ncbi:MAG: hypothetical protein CMJ64_05545 [Planctomycetaceae bacterium]|nr:hypothetical protein [Planctomycetaceae bacterium]
MPKIEVPEEQILDSLDQLSAEGRREAMKRLLPSAAYVQRAIERHAARIKELARQRGLDWDALSEQQREQLVDEILHE